MKIPPEARHLDGSDGQQSCVWHRNKDELSRGARRPESRTCRGLRRVKRQNHSSFAQPCTSLCAGQTPLYSRTHPTRQRPPHLLIPEPKSPGRNLGRPHVAPTAPRAGSSQASTSPPSTTGLSSNAADRFSCRESVSEVTHSVHEPLYCYSLNV